MALISLAAIQAATLNVKFGFPIDSELAQTILDNPVNFESQVPAGNIPLVCAPCVSISKNFDVEKPSYIGVSYGTNKDDTSKHYVNLSLTNIKPTTDVSGNKAITALFTTRYDAANAADVKKAALIAVSKLK